MADVSNFVNADYYLSRKAKSYIDTKNSSVADALSAIQTWMSAAESRISLLEAVGSGGDFASMFDIALSDVYHVETDADAPNIISNALNLSGFSTTIGTSGIVWKTPTVVIPTITWSDDVDDNYDFTAQANVVVRFGDAGTISKLVTFKRPGPGKLYAVKPTSGGYINTGITGNYAYKYHVKGHTQQGNQCVLADAFVDTSNRATVRFLGGSNKAQCMWASNKEITNATSGINYNKMFEMTVGANYCVFAQSGKTYTASLSGHTTSGELNATISLLGSTVSGYSNSILCFAEILDGDGNVLGYFAPYELDNGEIVMVNTSGITAQQILDIVENGDSAEMASHIFRPSAGTLIAVTQAEDEV